MSKKSKLLWTIPSIMICILAYLDAVTPHILSINQLIIVIASIFLIESITALVAISYNYFK